MKMTLPSAGIALLLLCLTFGACKADPNEASSVTKSAKEQAAPSTQSTEEKVWKGTKKHELTNNSATLRLPVAWQRSTRAVIANQEMPSARAKAHELMQIALRQLSPEDTAVDVWEADVEPYHALVMINTDTTPLTKARVTNLSRGLQANYKHMDETTEDTRIKIEDSSYKEDSNHQVAKFKYKFDREGTTAYLCTFFVTTPTRSFIVYELADDTSDIELYLYSLQ